MAIFFLLTVKGSDIPRGPFMFMGPQYINISYLQAMVHRTLFDKKHKFSQTSVSFLVRHLIKRKVLLLVAKVKPIGPCRHMPRAQNKYSFPGKVWKVDAQFEFLFHTNLYILLRIGGKNSMKWSPGVSRRTDNNMAYDTKGY